MGKKSKKSKSKVILFIDDVEIKTIEDLQENFDIDYVVEKFVDGQLLTWLETRYYDEEATKIRTLSKKDPKLQVKLCEIFDVNPADYVDEVIEHNERVEALMQYTNDHEILNNADDVAFNQEELGNLLDDGVGRIYLFNNKFSVPLRARNKKYIGIGRAIAIVPGNDPIDFNSLNISFENVQVENNYTILITDKSPEELCEIASKTKQDDRDGLKYCRKAIEGGNIRAIWLLGNSYLGGYGVKRDVNKAIELFEEAANKGDSEAMDDLGYIYWQGKIVPKDISKAIRWYEAAVKKGNIGSMTSLARIYWYGNDVEESPQKAFNLFLKAAQQGDLNAMSTVADFYYKGYGTERNFLKAKYWYEKCGELEKFERMYAKDRPYDNSCFITTAVCNNFHKPDDCYELTSFRKFRDEWLINKSDGKSLIDEYYEIAPKIVNRINQLPNANEIYQSIWQDHLKPCLKFIELGNNEKCKQLYCDMVNSLKAQFLS